jgi:LEA14-like dessication related protein
MIGTIVETNSMKNKGIIIGGAVVAAGAAAYYIYQKKSAVTALNVNISKVDFNKQSKKIVVFLRLINPSNASLSIKSIVADVIWKGSAGATIDYRVPFVLKSLEEKTIELPVKLNLDLLTVVSSFLTGKLKDAVSGKFELKGSVNAEGLVVPINYSKDISFVDAKK